MRGVKLAHYGACSNNSTGVKLLRMKLVFIIRILMMIMVIFLMMMMIIIIIIAHLTPSKSA